MITELEDFQADRVDGVGNPANGVDEFLVIKASGQVVKRDFSAEERRKLAAEGKALPDGAFPIETRQDLKNAIRTIGLTTKPKNTVRRFIRTRAKALNAENLIPESWEGKKSMTKKAIGAAGDGRGLLDLGATLQALQTGMAAIQESLAELKNSTQLGQAQTDPDPELAAKAAAIAKAIEATQQAIDAERQQSSTGEAGSGAKKPATGFQTSIKKIKKLKKEVKRYKKAAQRDESGRFVAKDDKNDDGDKGDKNDKNKKGVKVKVKVKKGTPPLTSALAGAITGGSPGLETTWNASAEWREALAGRPEAEKAMVTKAATLKALRPLIAAMAPVPPGFQREMAE